MPRGELLVDAGCHRLVPRSLPSATRKIYLDFDGHTVTSSGWNSDTNEVLEVPPYDHDDDLTTFGASEKAYIIAIWRGVAEDFLAFEVRMRCQAGRPAGCRPLCARPRWQRMWRLACVVECGGVAGLPVPGRCDHRGSRVRGDHQVR